MLNKFQGGPLDQMVYASSTLLSDARLAHLVQNYIWTSEIITSDLTGRTARVWLFQPAQPDTVSPNVDNHGRGNTKMTAPQESQETGTVEAEAQPAAEPVQTADLLETRKRLGLSRTPVAEAAGVSIAMLARIEKGGARTTAEEAQVVRNALAKLEQEAAQAPAAEPATAGNPG